MALVSSVDLQAARIEVVVLDRVAGPQDVRVLAAAHRADEVELHVERQRGRDPVRIDLVRVEALGLEIDLVAVALREAHDLVLDRRAVARADALDDARVHRRAVEAAADDVVGARVGVRDPARPLRRMHVARAEEREHRRRDRRPAAPRAPRSRSCGRRAAAACRSSGARPAARARAGARPAAWPADRPRGRPRSCDRPTWMSPDRKVPVVRTTASAWKTRPISVTTPATRSPSSRRSSTGCWNSVRLGWFSSRRRMARL